MNDKFSGWYLIANPDSNDDVVKRRWEAVANTAAELTANTAFDLALVYHGLRPIDAQSSFISSIRTADASFTPQGHELEIAILAGASLYEAFQNSDDEDGIAAALSIVVPHFAGLRKKPHLPELIDLAEQNLAERSTHLRKIDDTPQGNSGTAQDVIDAAATALSESQFPVAGEQLKKILTSQRNAFIAQGERLSQLEGRYSLLREESDILWWLTGLQSRVENRPFSSLEVGAASLLIGFELGELTRVIPGPLSAHAFIDRMLLGSFSDTALAATVTFGTAINDLSGERRTEWASRWSNLHGRDLCPVVTAVINSMAVEKPSEWPPLFKKSQGVDAKSKLTPQSLGRQIYLESLLLRAGN